MGFRIPGLSLAGAAVILAAALAPAQALAQHAAVRVGPRSTVVVGAYYRPYHYGYRGYYGAPYFYGSWYFGYPWYPAGAYYYGYPYAYYDLGASMRLQVMPRVTEVFVDGYYAGTVDDFDGVFQRLNIEPGDHDVELYLPGHRSVVERVYLQPGKTTSIKHTMQPLAPGEAEPVKPSATQTPAITPVPRRKPDAGGGPSAGRPPRRPPPPPDEAVATAPASGRTDSSGSVSLRVQPGAATILIDGERWEGAAGDDRLVVQVSPGRHVIDVQKDGYRQYTTEITVKPGETATLNISLTRQ